MVKRYHNTADQTGGNRIVESASLTAENTFTEATEFYFGASFNLSISGTWSGTITLQRSFDGGVTWLDVQDYTANAEDVVSSPEPGVLWRAGFKTGEYTSNTAVVRLSGPIA